MNTKVLEKIYKGNVELSEFNVELGLRDDVIASYQKYLGQRDAAKKEINKAENAVISAYNNYAGLAGLANGALGIVGDMEKKVKELGLELDPDMLGVKKRVTEDLKKLKANAGSIQNVAKTLSDVKTSIV